MLESLLEAKAISKSFFGVPAIKDVELYVKKGEVHALIGENGAGKSTLMKIIIGAQPYDSGNMIFKGESYKPSAPIDAIKKGISMIHQEISLAPNMSVIENIWLGREEVKGGFVDFSLMKKKTENLLNELGLDIDPGIKVENLSVAKQQMVEIARAVSYNSDLIIMDEPTSALTERETRKLFEIIRMLKSKGVSTIIITHRMEELFEISDTVTVFRDGRYVGMYPIEEITQEKLVSLMVGRKVTNLFPKETAEIKETILKVENYSKKGVFENVSFEVRKGEILGVAGLMGAGRSEVMEAIFSGEKVDSGQLYIDGKKVDFRSPRDAIKNGMAMVTEDRKLTGLALGRSSGENISICNLDKYSHSGFINKIKEKEDIKKMISALSIRLSDPNQLVKSLSGGNQQKVIIAKWLLTEPRILILDEPTRGIDVGAKAEIHRLISELACKGVAIIMISSELPEVIGMSDRIMVMHEGKVKGEIMREDATQELIMKYATNTMEGN